MKLRFKMLLIATALLRAAHADELKSAHDHAAMLAAEAQAVAPIPGGSLQQLPVTLTDRDGTVLTFRDLAGHPVIVTMFYSSCTAICPVLTLALRRIEASLTDTQRADMNFLMVSLDADHDTPAVLSRFADEHHLRGSHWHLAHANQNDARLIAAALGIRYRTLPDGSFNHSSVLSLLDRTGTVLLRSEQITTTDLALQAALQAQWPTVTN